MDLAVFRRSHSQLHSRCYLITLQVQSTQARPPQQPDRQSQHRPQSGRKAASSRKLHLMPVTQDVVKHKGCLG